LFVAPTPWREANSESSTAAEAVDFTRVLETSAFAKYLIFRLKYHLLFEPFELPVRATILVPKSGAKKLTSDSIIATKQMKISPARTGAREFNSQANCERIVLERLTGWKRPLNAII
jgi:hypothetical protein